MLPVNIALQLCLQCGQYMSALDSNESSVQICPSVYNQVYIISSGQLWLKMTLKKRSRHFLVKLSPVYIHK